MGKVIGIDLGTTNSCVAIVEKEHAVVIHNKEGARTTPSMVAWSEKGDIIIGVLARRQAVTNPTRTIYSAKRILGRKYDSKEMLKLFLSGQTMAEGQMQHAQSAPELDSMAMMMHAIAPYKAVVEESER